MRTPHRTAGRSRSPDRGPARCPGRAAGSRRTRRTPRRSQQASCRCCDVGHSQGKGLARRQIALPHCPFIESLVGGLAGDAPTLWHGVPGVETVLGELSVEALFIDAAPRSRTRRLRASTRRPAREGSSPTRKAFSPERQILLKYQHFKRSRNARRPNRPKSFPRPFVADPRKIFHDSTA